MKNILVGSLICLLIWGCNKENENPEIKSYRLKSWYDSTSNALRFDVSYEGEKVSGVLLSINSKPSCKDAWRYEEKKIFIERYYPSDTGWRGPFFIRELTYNDDGKLIRAYTPGEYINNVYIYNWEGDKVSYQIIGNDTIYYSYENNLLNLMTYQRGNGNSLGCERLNYTEGKVTDMTYWNTDTTRKAKFTYQGDKLYQIIKTDPSGQVHSGSKTETYIYDNNGNLSQKVRYDEDWNSTHTTFFEYEPGKGNFDQYWLYRHGWLVYYLYPNMIPAEDAHGRYSNYGLDEGLMY